jgi:hypothetical protein
MYAVVNTVYIDVQYVCLLSRACRCKSAVQTMYLDVYVFCVVYLFITTSPFIPQSREFILASPPSPHPATQRWALLRSTKEAVSTTLLASQTGALGGRIF